MGTYTNGLTPLDIATIVYIVLTLIGLLIVYSLLRRIIRQIGELWSKESLFGRDLKTKLISLGIVAILFPSMFYFIGSAIINFIGNFFVDVPLSLFTNWQTNQSFCSSYDPNFRLCLGQLGYGFVQAWTSALADALNRFGPGYISYSKLVLMLAVWAGVALFLSATSAKDKDDKDGAERKIRLHSVWDGLSKANKQNLMFFSILILAGYLSIAAIAAIPGLEETAVPSEAVSVERLEQQLQDALTQSQARIPRQLDFSEPFATATSPATSATSAPTEGAPVPATTAGADDYLKVRREQWSNIYAKLVEDVQLQADNSKATAISAYRASVIDRKGSKETIQHFLDIDAWFRRELNRMEAQLGECRRRIANVDGLMVSISAQPQDVSWNSSLNQALQNAEQDARETCQSMAVAEPVPERQDLGSNMGPFSYIASWLLRTESLPLAQIVGLLGFGLLGSAVSSLVRSKRQWSEDKPLVEELATLIIRGATAAVVVFLAVKGGLAIFTSGDSNANSYVLLLTCLIAAVFSEDVWAEAHKRLNRELNREEKPSKPRSQSTPEQQPNDEQSNQEPGARQSGNG